MLHSGNRKQPSRECVMLLPQSRQPREKRPLRRRELESWKRGFVCCKKVLRVRKRSVSSMSRLGPGLVSWKQNCQICGENLPTSRLYLGKRMQRWLLLSRRIWMWNRNLLLLLEEGVVQWVVVSLSDL